jgi:pentafunctional AROM polypeptide
VADNRPTLDNKTPTSFLSLTFPDVGAALADMAELTEGADAIELRVDLLSPSGQAPGNGDIPPAEYVSQQLSMLRLVSPLPIVYSVRTVEQGGRAPSDNAEAYASLVKLGQRSACEYVDLEMAFPDAVLSSLTRSKGNSHMIASWHDWTGKMKWDSSVVEQKYNQCAAHGDVVKIVGTATSVADNLALSAFVTAKTRHEQAKPFLAINMGPHGQLSRILNPTLTPVTHAKMPSVAAPGQLTNKQVLQARHLMGLLPKQQFYQFGSPIGASVSPTLHNTGFETLGLPHLYGKHETAEVDADVERIIRSADFGGASVTIPLKLAIMDKLDSVSDDAKIIGAVNTIIPTQGGKLHGDNTDWQAIREAAIQGGAASGCVGLVIGAGGTCRAAIYALYKLGASQILLYNRTRANAESVAASFGSEYAITVIDDLTAVSGADVVISTVPGDSLTLAADGKDGIALPESVLAKEKGVAIDLAYKPRDTALVRLAVATKGWTAVTGVEILVLQGLRQFELWTGKKAPAGKIRAAVMAQYGQ